MSFLRLDGWRVPVLNEQAREEYAQHGEVDASFTGRPNRRRRGLPRKWQHDAGYLTSQDADTLEMLLERKAHKFGFERDAFSDSGIGPEAGGAYTITPRNPADGGFGWSYVNVIGTLTYDMRLPDSQWTVAWWRVGVGTRTETHLVVRSDGAKWIDGVRADATPTAELTVSNGAVAFTAGQYDNLWIAPLAVSDSFAAMLWRWQSGRGLVFDVRFEGAALDVRRHNQYSSQAGNFVRGVVAQSMLFALATDRARFNAGVGDHGVFGKVQFSVATWVRLDVGGGTPSIAYQINAGGWHLSVNATKHVTFTLVTGAGTVSVTSSTPLVVGAWTHVAATWDQITGVGTLYLDGVDVSSARVSFPGSAAASDVLADLTIGNNAGLTAVFPGAIDEMRLHSVALSADEVVEHWQGGLAGVRPPGVQAFRAGHPGLVAFGASTGWREVATVPSSEGQDYQQAGGQLGWVNNLRKVTTVLDEYADFESSAIQPTPSWQWFLGAPSNIGTVIQPARGGIQAIRSGGTFVLGPQGAPGNVALGVSLAGTVDLPQEIVVALADSKAVSVMAWVRRSSTGSGDTILNLTTAGASTRLLFSINAAGALFVSARGAAADALQTHVSALTMLSTTQWSCVGCVVNVAGDSLTVFKDGQSTSSAAAFASTFFTPEVGTLNRIGLDVAGADRFSGDILCVGIWPRALTLAEHQAIHAAGIGGVFR